MAPTETRRDDPEDTDLVIRPATTGDLTAVAEVFLACRATAVPAMPPIVHPPEEVRSQVGSWDLEARRLWVAQGPTGIVGFADVQGSWLNGLYVHPEHAGTGIGSALLDLVKGVQPGGFWLWVFESNEPARAFYRRHGLIELDRTDGSGNEEQAPDLRMAWPGLDPVAFLRSGVDDVDRGLAELLARRFALTAAIQRHKEVPGHAGRDEAREREIVAQMVAHAPGPPAGSIARIMHLVITESLDAVGR